MGERSGAPRASALYQSSFSKPPVAVQLPQPDVSANRDAPQRDGAPAFIFDLMEPERPKIDRAIIEFFKADKLHPADFTIRRDGVVRLNPQLARRVTGQLSRFLGKCGKKSTCEITNT